MYMHGYTEGSEVQSVHVSIEAFLKRGEHNIILLEWSELASGNYFVDAVPNADMVRISLLSLNPKNILNCILDRDPCC